MATRTISNAGGAWNAVGTWVEGIVPTANDSVVATATSGNVTFANVSNVCGTMDLTSYLGTFTFTNGRSLNIGNATLGDVIFGAGMTMSIPTTGFSIINLISTKASASITSNGIVLSELKINSPASACTYTIQDNLSLGLFIVQAGNFNANNKNIIATSATGISIQSGTTTMGSGTWTTQGWDSSNGAIIAGTSTLILTGSAAEIITGGAGLYNLTISANCNAEFQDAITIVGNFIINAGAKITIDASQGASIDVSSAISFVINASQGNIVKFVSDSPGVVQWALSGNGGTYNFSWLNLEDSNALFGTWNATSSIDSGNNSGWNITAPVAGGGSGQGSLMLMSCGS